ncbi:MAG TPA: hypothetical protein VGO04_02525 [Ensifer sp.]|jgi:ribulose-phosphate 3-epimerase|uniref:ribulose-phosphate 3-epimerase n=1 Tax=Ensifer sp. TaxID=1872086 RepID=UPI002E12527E|nr:hypothetical protein [Ensifer sp.]
MTALSPSLYAADPLLITDELEAVAPYAESFHLDVMDGQFAPEFGLNFRFIRDLAQATEIPLDVHLMLARPRDAVVRVAEMGVRSIAVHVEIKDDLRDLVSIIRRNGGKAYAALRHTTPVSVLEPILEAIDGCLFLTAPAGGGKFDELAFERLAQRPKGLHTVVDGKIGPEHFARLRAHGVDVAVVGGALFSNGHVAERAAKFVAALAG